MTNDQIIQKTKDFLEAKFCNETTGHDYWHMYRVWKLSKFIASKEEGADMFTVELAALLHDIEDWKFNDDLEAGPQAARQWLESLGVKEKVIVHIEEIIRNISFKGADVEIKLKTLEGKIVSDADKLDGMGAIGVGRVFTYSGAKGRLMHDPKLLPKKYASPEEFKNNTSSAINHFYEKLLLLKDRMFTKTGKELAKHRHEYLEQFLKEFYAEWEGEC